MIMNSYCLAREDLCQLNCSFIFLFFSFFLSIQVSIFICIIFELQNSSVFKCKKPLKLYFVNLHKQAQLGNQSQSEPNNQNLHQANCTHKLGVHFCESNFHRGYGSSEANSNVLEFSPIFIFIRVLGCRSNCL